MLRSLLLYALTLSLAASCSADLYYYETVSYDVESSAAQMLSSCQLQVVALVPNLSSLRITLPYSQAELSSTPTVLVGKKVVEPVMLELGNVSLLVVDFSPMKVGEMRNVVVKYSTRGGVELRPGARVEVRTLGLEGNVTAQTMNLELPKTLTVASIETPYGLVKAGRSGAIPLIMERKSVKLVFTIRKRTVLDNRYFLWGLVLLLVAIPPTFFLYRRHRHSYQTDYQGDT